MATIVKNELKNGTSYRIQVKVKEENTGKFLVKAMTWKKPADVKETEAKRLVQKVAFDFEEKIYNQNAGIQVKENNVVFIDYARDRLERQKTTISLHTYVKETRMINEFEKFFCRIKMQDMSPSIIQDFLDMKQRIGKLDIKAISKKKFKALLHEIKLLPSQLQKMAKVSKPLYLNSQRGNKIEVESAKAMCNALNVRYCDYFTTIKVHTPYAKSTVNAYRKALCAIFATAKRQRLIEHNYASRDYIKAIKGPQKEIQILDENQARVFAEAIEKDDNIERKIALMTFLYMGIRRSELAGLQWKDINFETGTMHIQRSLHFEPRFGKFYKSTKTESSNREIKMPDRLLEEYKKYKQWWNENRTYTTKPEYEDAVFKNGSGEAYEPSLFIVWLRKVLKKAGLPAVTLHSIRHTNISLQLMAGVDIKTVASRAGHSMASTTSDIYSHFMRSSDIKASNIIDNIFEDE